MVKMNIFLLIKRIADIWGLLFNSAYVYVELPQLLRRKSLSSLANSDRFVFSINSILLLSCQLRIFLQVWNDSVVTGFYTVKIFLK